MERDGGTRQPPRLDPSTMTLVPAPGRRRVKDVGHQGVSTVANGAGCPCAPLLGQPPGVTVSLPSSEAGPNGSLHPLVSLTRSVKSVALTRA